LLRTRLKRRSKVMRNLEYMHSTRCGEKAGAVKGVLKPKIDVRPGLKSLQARRMIIYLNRLSEVAA